MESLSHYKETCNFEVGDVFHLSDETMAQITGIRGNRVTLWIDGANHSTSVNVHVSRVEKLFSTMS